LAVLKGKKATVPPIWLMRQAGRHLEEYMKLRKKAKTFLDFCYSPNLSVEATLQPIYRYNLDAAILFSDILVVPDALGQHVKFVTGTGPVLDALSTLEDIKRLNLDHLHTHLSPVYEAIQRVRQKMSLLPHQPTLIGFAGAPWTVATYMVEGGGSKDYYKTREWAYKSPDEFKVLINILVEATSEYLIRQIDNGVEAVQLFDSWAGLLPPNQFDRWVIKPTKKIIARVRSIHPDIPIIGFPRGAGLLYEQFVIKTGVNAVSIDQTVPLAWAVKTLQIHCTIQGNLDNLVLLLGGKPMEDEISQILSSCSSGPFIFNLGHGVLPKTPTLHVDRLIEMVRMTSNG
jgi:uroporphyrinogen decarboxylase